MVAVTGTNGKTSVASFTRADHPAPCLGRCRRGRHHPRRDGG
jgi:hypothetical protein